MSTVIVVDASVALKWVVAEPGSQHAEHLLADMLTGTVSLVAPEHLIGEVSNGLRKRVAQKILTPHDALEAVDAIADLGLELVGGWQRWVRCLRAALQWQITTYDALYILLAQDLDATLITADERLATTAHAHLLPVELLTSYPWQFAEE